MSNTTKIRLALLILNIGCMVWNICYHQHLVNTCIACLNAFVAGEFYANIQNDR